MPIYQTTRPMSSDDARQAGARFDLKEEGLAIYTRLNNPTTGGAETLAALEGGAAAVATASLWRPSPTQF